MGRACFLGEGRTRDLSEAFLWIRRSAEQGYSQAQFVLGRFYLDGVATSQDGQEALAWATKAARQNHADAMGLVGLCHEFGAGTPRSATNALAWLHRALDAGSGSASTWLGRYYLRGEAGTARRTNYVEALRWFERAASNGVPYAALRVAELCSNGQGTPPDLPRALYWLQRYADRGDPTVLETLCGYYAGGHAEPRGPDDAPTLLLRRAAEARAAAFSAAGAESWAFTPSWALIYDCRDLWSRYRYGIGTPRDYVASARWMWQAYQEDLRRVAAGQRSLSRQDTPAYPFEPILKGEAPPLTADERLWHQAVRLIHEALDQGRPETWQRIGESYRDGGPLTPKDPVQAWAWFNPAADSGHAPARDALKALETTLTPDELGQAKRSWLPPLTKARQR